jgi:hypothetical protein
MIYFEEENSVFVHTVMHHIFSSFNFILIPIGIDTEKKNKYNTFIFIFFCTVKTVETYINIKVFTTWLQRVVLYVGKKNRH